MINGRDNKIVVIYNVYDSSLEVVNKGNYTTNDINDLVCELLRDSIYTSKDSIQNLIYDLERLKEEV